MYKNFTLSYLGTTTYVHIFFKAQALQFSSDLPRYTYTYKEMTKFTDNVPKHLNTYGTLSYDQSTILFSRQVVKGLMS